MADLSTLNPTGRFSGLADIYAKYRPEYPEAALAYIERHCSLTGDTLLVDVGCGTGISTRLFAARGIPAIGVEPNAEMRAKAESADGGGCHPKYVDGRGEATGLPDACAQIVLAAQAFHWFEPEEALREFRRILKPAGWAVVMWNTRDECDAFTSAYGNLFRQVAGAADMEGRYEVAAQAFLATSVFHAPFRVSFPNSQVLDEDGLVGRSFSASYAPREPVRAKWFEESLRELFRQHAKAGKVTLCYACHVHLGQKI